MNNTGNKAEMVDETEGKAQSSKQYLDKDDLRAMVNANKRLTDAQKTYENIGLQVRVLELEYNILLKDLQQKYGLSDSDRIDNITGEILEPTETKGE